MAARKKTAKKTKPAMKSTPKTAALKKKAKALPKKTPARKAASKTAGPNTTAAPKVKAAPKALAAPKAKAAPSVPARRDRAGHIAQKYGRELLAQSGGPDRDDPSSGFLKGARSDDDLAEQLGESVIEEATSGENEGEDILDQEVPEERGGPFVITTASTEFAYAPDASNPKRSRREPFPRT